MNRNTRDEGLIGNEKIEEAVLALQSEASLESTQMRLQTVKTADGAIWWAAFTSFDEEIKGADSVMSTFLSDIDKLFETALEVPEINGIIVNPWNRTIMLDKELIKIIMGQSV